MLLKWDIADRYSGLEAGAFHRDIVTAPRLRYNAARESSRGCLMLRTMRVVQAELLFPSEKEGALR